MNKFKFADDKEEIWMANGCLKDKDDNSYTVKSEHWKNAGLSSNTFQSQDTMLNRDKI